LFTGIFALDWPGCKCYERSDHDLDGRGGGGIIGPMLLEAFQRAGDPTTLGVVIVFLLFKTGW